MSCRHLLVAPPPLLLFWWRWQGNYTHACPCRKGFHDRRQNAAQSLNEGSVVTEAASDGGVNTQQLRSFAQKLEDPCQTG